MPVTIKNIKAYSETDGLDKVIALKGEYDATGETVTIFFPYEQPNGGPAQNEPFTLAFDQGNQPVTLKHMQYDGVIPHTNSLFFVG